MYCRETFHQLRATALQESPYLLALSSAAALQVYNAKHQLVASTAPSYLVFVCIPSHCNKHHAVLAVKKGLSG